MGLDMYLSRKIYIWANDRGNLKITGGKIPVRNRKVKEIVEEAGYWRKANAIHNWMVENVQYGEDNCKEYEVSEEQMKELLGTVNKVLKASKLVKGAVTNGYTSNGDGKMVPNIETGKIIKDATVAKSLLPTSEGFFFGGTDYDECYYQDLVDTKKILEEALKIGKGAYFTYRASW